MSDQRPLRDEDAIHGLIADLLVATRGEKRPPLASAILERLAVAVHDHRIAEQRALAATLDAAFGNRHAASAIAAMRDLARVEEAWSRYLYRWSLPAIAEQWEMFGVATQMTMPAIRAELARETGILASLAAYYRVLATVD